MENDEEQFYQQPSWAGTAYFSNKCEDDVSISLEFSNQGIILSQHDLQDPEKSYYVIGQNNSDINLNLEDQSKERLAILQHKNSGGLYIYSLQQDLFTLNKEKIKLKKYTEIKDGDILEIDGLQVMGIFSLCIEDDNQIQSMNDQNLQKTIENIKKEDQRRKDLIFNQKQQLSEMHWGMDLNEDLGQANQLDPSDIDQLNLDKILNQSKELGLSDKIIEQIRKLSNLREKLNFNLQKSQQLKSAEDLEFDESKITSKLEKQEKRTKDLQIYIEKEEEKVRKILWQKYEEQVGKTNAIRTYDKEESEDEYFDRTKQSTWNTAKQTEQIKDEQRTLSYMDLKQIIQNLQDERDQITQELLSACTKKLQQNDDEFEKFMQANENNIIVEQKKKMSERIKQINIEIENTKKMFSLVQPTKVIMMSGQQKQQTKEVSFLKAGNQKKAVNPVGIADTIKRLEKKRKIEFADEEIAVKKQKTNEEEEESEEEHIIGEFQKKGLTDISQHFLLKKYAK